VAEVAHRGTDRARVALDDDHAETTGAGLDGVRQADDAGADDDEVSRHSRRVVGPRRRLYCHRTSFPTPDPALV
jgi:hypothetical protein